MRAKYINEAFKDESDPIHDMGIGTDKVIRDWLETIGDFKNYPRLNNWIWICIKHNKPEYADYLLKKHPHTMDVHMDDDNPMNWAIFNNNSESVRVLLDNGASIKRAKEELANAISKAKKKKEVLGGDQTNYSKIKKIIHEYILNAKLRYQFIQSIISFINYLEKFCKFI